MTSADWSLAELEARLRSHGCTRAFVKQLAPNDNSKNQPYIAKERSLIGFSVLPVRNVRAEGRNFKADVVLSWLLDDGSASLAPHAKLIQYRRYNPPEVRLSGFLRGCPGAPATIMTTRAAGRVLVIGVRPDGSMIARAATVESSLARDVAAIIVTPRATPIAALWEIDLSPGPVDTTSELLEALRAVHQRGPISGRRRNKQGEVVPYAARNAAGMTLEAELGIGANSSPLPDYLGWELKVVKTPDLSRSPTPAAAVTVMTPEPTGGYYVTPGYVPFMEQYGRPDDALTRRDFTDRLLAGLPGKRSKATLRIEGLSVVDDRVDVAPDGRLVLVMHDGIEGAEWRFTSLVEHWNTKHSRTAFVPYVRSTKDGCFEYANWVMLGRGTDFSKFLVALQRRSAYFDPGMNVKYAIGRAVPHRRSQFRSRYDGLIHLYSAYSRKPV